MEGRGAFFSAPYCENRGGGTARRSFIGPDARRAAVGRIKRRKRAFQPERGGLAHGHSIGTKSAASGAFFRVKQHIRQEKADRAEKVGGRM